MLEEYIVWFLIYILIYISYCINDILKERVDRFPLFLLMIFVNTVWIFRLIINLISKIEED